LYDRYLFPENRFGLTTITLLFSVVTTATLRSSALLRLLVLSHFVGLVTFAFLAVRTTTLRYVHLEGTIKMINVKLLTYKSRALTGTQFPKNMLVKTLH
jgi:hypothetical protein